VEVARRLDELVADQRRAGDVVVPRALEIRHDAGGHGRRQTRIVQGALLHAAGDVDAEDVVERTRRKPEYAGDRQGLRQLKTHRHGVTLIETSSLRSCGHPSWL